MARCQEIDDFRLQNIGILVFVNQNMKKLLRERLQDIRMFPQEPQAIDQKIIEIHDGQIFFSLLVMTGDRMDVPGQMQKERISAVQDVIQGAMRVDGQAHHLGNNVVFGKF